MRTQFAVELARTLPAPRSRVYRAWLDPELLARWLSPEGCAVTLAEVDERVGGAHHVEMLDPDGSRHGFESVIEELVPDERIVLAFTFVEPDDGCSREPTRLTVTLRDGERPGSTHLVLRQERITLGPPFDTESVTTGWGQALAKLAALYERS